MSPRYSIIPAGAVTDPRIEARDLQVLCLLGRHIDDLGWCRRSQVKMAKELGCARSTVQGSLDRLIAAEWVEKRPEQSEGKGDTAHSYRVRLDLNGTEPFYRDLPKSGRGPKSGYGDGQSGNTTVSAAPAPPADLSAPPVPVQERHPLPIYGSAPLTSPVKRKSERDVRAGGQAEPLPRSRLNLRPVDGPEREAAFQLLLRPPNQGGYPPAAIDDIDRARSAWGDVAEEEWQPAVDAIPRMVRARQDIRRGTVPGLEKYIRQSMWKSFPQPASAATAEPAVELKPFVVPLWAMLWGAIDPAGKNHLPADKVEYFLSRISKGLTTPASALPKDGDAEPLVPVEIGSDDHAAWMAHCERLGVRLPRPDAIPVVYVPSKRPPPLKPSWKGYRLAVPQRLMFRSTAWWWRLHKIEDGAIIEAQLREGGRSHGSVGVDMGPWPSSGELAGMVEIVRMSDPWRAWAKWFDAKSVNVDLWSESSIWCPSEYPPLSVAGTKELTT